jgi:hypothetical protein
MTNPAGFEALLQTIKPTTGPQTHLIKSNVTLGSPRYECAGTGICSLTLYRQPLLSRGSCQQTTGWLATSDDKSTISIYFVRQVLCSRLYANHFYKGVFKMTETVAIPKDICEALGIKSAILSPGNYTVHENGNTIRIDLACQ